MISPGHPWRRYRLDERIAVAAWATLRGTDEVWAGRRREIRSRRC